VRLVSFVTESGPRAGVVSGDVVVEAQKALERGGHADADSYRTVRDLLRGPEGTLGALSEAAAEHASELGVELDALELGPPVADPDKILCVGLNYRDHADEAELAVPDYPVLFPKFRTSLIGSGAPFELLAISDQWDFEAELAVVIGRRATAVTADAALDHVAGYMPFNDLSARDVQLRISQWMTGKAIDGSGPCGPELVLVDEVPDPQALDICLRLNGETLQRANTSEMIFPVARLIEYISSFITLEPGDIIATGTPAGVGFKRNPPIYLSAGDQLETEIEGLGNLITPIVAPTRPA
jgi:2-keto-4-pentenoate hydratase/2-oxohepta-3-ene-1,7-dioic acid hydratase in catechol pathway